MKKEDFGYYIFIDYSGNLIGYSIIEKQRIKELLSKISKLRHFKNVKHANKYILAIRKRIERDKIKELLFKFKIKEVRYNIDLFVDIIDFIGKHKKSIIFICIDNHHYYTFLKLIKVYPYKNNLFIIKESNLRKDSIEYKLSLIIDNLLNVERLKR